MSYKRISPQPVVEGGTGVISSTAYAPIVGGTTSTGAFQAASTGLSTSGFVLTSNGASAIPSFQAASSASITITGDSGGGLTGNSFTFTGGSTGLTFAGSGTTETLGGTLVVANGGTGAATLTGVLIGNGTSAVTGNAITQHDVLVGGASNAITSVAPSATSGVPLISAGSSTNPSFGTAVVAGGGTGATTLTANGVLLGNGTSAISTVAVGTTGQVLTGVTGSAPTFQSPAASSITITGDSGGALTGSSFTFTGGSTGLTFAGSGTTETLGGILGVGYGGTGAANITGILIGNGGTGPVTGNTVTQYDVLVGAAANGITSIAPSATAGVPLISGGSAANPSFGTAVVAGGGTGITTTTAYAPIVGGTTATGPFQAATTGFSNSGYVLTSTGSSSLPTWQASAAGGITWTDVTGGSATLAKSNGYVADSASLTTFTMPTNNAIGDTIYIVGKGSGGWKIVYTTSQYIIFGSSTTTTTTGDLASTNANDCVTLVCTTASASAPIFTVMTSIGNITVV
jgi:hypothetical protein